MWSERSSIVMKERELNLAHFWKTEMLFVNHSNHCNHSAQPASSPLTRATSKHIFKLHSVTWFDERLQKVKNSHFICLLGDEAVYTDWCVYVSMNTEWIHDCDYYVFLFVSDPTIMIIWKGTIVTVLQSEIWGKAKGDFSQTHERRLKSDGRTVWVTIYILPKETQLMSNK